MKKTEVLFEMSSKYDSKHITNANKGRKVPQEILDEIEAGCSLETLEKLLGKNYKVFKYKTQLTIHGEFPELSTRRIGGYSNLFQNKNLSIGVRWNAVDYEKKTKLYSLLKFTDGWSIEHNSQEYSVLKMERVDSSDCEKAKETVLKYRAISEKIDRSLFFGNVNCYLAKSMWGFLYVVLSLNINSFYERNMKAIFNNITGKDFDAEMARKAEHDEAVKIAEEKKWKENEERWEKERKEKEAKKATLRTEFLRTNPVPKGYKKVDKYYPKKGEEFLKLRCEERFDGEITYKWVVYKATTSFGRILLNQIDPETGKKKGKGIAVKDYVVNFYLKIA